MTCQLDQRVRSRSAFESDNRQVLLVFEMPHDESKARNLFDDRLDARSSCILAPWRAPHVTAGEDTPDFETQVSMWEFAAQANQVAESRMKLLSAELLSAELTSYVPPKLTSYDYELIPALSS